MNARTVLLGLLLTACGGQGTPAEGPAAGDAAAAAEAVRQDDTVVRVATTARRIEANPDDVEAILREDGWLRADFEAALYSIAADAEQARRYRDLLASPQ